MLGKNKKLIAIVIAVLVSISMIVPSFTLLFSDSNNNVAANSDTIAATSQGLEKRVKALQETLEANPKDSSSRLELANAFYDLGVASFDSSSEKAVEYFSNAVKEYQEVRKTDNNVGVIVDMATSAFYGGQFDLAEKTFKEAIEVQPDFLYGLVNYGIFLMDGKNDYLGAITQWHTALTKGNPNDQQAKQIQSYIDFAQQKLSESTGTSKDNTGK